MHATAVAGSEVEGAASVAQHVYACQLQHQLQLQLATTLCEAANCEDFSIFVVFLTCRHRICQRYDNNNNNADNRLKKPQCCRVARIGRRQHDMALISSKTKGRHNSSISASQHLSIAIKIFLCKLMKKGKRQNGVGCVQLTNKYKTQAASNCVENRAHF